MAHVDLTPAEEIILRDTLEGVLSDLNMEIAGTDSQDFRDGLKQRRLVLQKVLASLGERPPL